ncbi:MAG: hypothetical protein IJ548_01615 [Paludibacteraceae bacterium]|nr:hypothetical protein [Paludibacteraceae bacterium]MBQ8704982.1 hypothetical protein [Paludibacteraceae bacterium]
MKTRILFFAAIVVIMIACNPSEPSVSQDAYLSRSYKWEVDYTVEDGITSSRTILVGKDTVISNKTYRMIDNYYPMRQTQSRIYMYNYESKKEILLYDFSLKEGDYIEQQEDPFGGIPRRKAKVIKTEVITLADGRKARRIEYEQTYPAPRDPDVEYVGNERRGILGPLDNSMTTSTLKAFYENNILLYPYQSKQNNGF